MALPVTVVCESNVVASSAGAIRLEPLQQPYDKHNYNISYNFNNVKGLVGHDAAVHFLSICSNLTCCEEACWLAATTTTSVGGPGCESFAWHHLDFPKAEYRGHCYGHSDSYWQPVAQTGVDSGRYSGSPLPPQPVCDPSSCSALTNQNGNGTCADCMYNGACAANGTCSCASGWTGTRCELLDISNTFALMSYPDALWTWGGSPIRDAVTGIYHLYSSELSNNCGILHYCSNSRVIHLTSSTPLGPYTRQGVALGPRTTGTGGSDGKTSFFDSASVHGPTVHRLPNGTYALFYTGMAADGPEPNCTHAYDPHTGNRASRRIGLALANSLDGPWHRLPSPVFGPCAPGTGWDYSDTSNAAPIIRKDGSVVLLYKGRGHVQAIGIAFAPGVEGPYTRNKTWATTVPGEE